MLTGFRNAGKEFNIDDSEGIWDQSFGSLALLRESEVVEEKLKGGHVHAVASIPPKYSVSQAIGHVKGKSAIWVAGTTGKNRNFVGWNFWARGYCVLTIGLDE